MQYPLLKSLQQANFPTDVDGEWLTIEIAGGGVDKIFEPSIEGLLQACGPAFTELRDLQNLQLHVVHPMDIPPDKKYEAVSTNQRRLKYGHGHDMKEALANLFLAQQNPVFGL